MTTEDVLALQGQAAQVKVDPILMDYLMDIVEASRTHEQLHVGISPRGALALMQAAQALALIEGRDFVTPTTSSPWSPPSAPTASSPATTSPTATSKPPA